MQQLSSTSLRVLVVNSYVINRVQGFIFNSQRWNLGTLLSIQQSSERTSKTMLRARCPISRPAYPSQINSLFLIRQVWKPTFMSHAHSLGCKQKPHDNLDDFMHKFSKTKVTFQHTHFQLYLDTLIHMSMLCSNVHPQLPLLTYSTLTQL